MTPFKTYDFKGRKAIVRVDFNVPLSKETFKITDDKRMQAALPTIKKIISDGGSVILLSHLGRPKNGPENAFSLKHLCEHLSIISGAKVFFSPDCIGSKTEQAAKNLKGGEILLVENVRFYKEETKGDISFAQKLAKLGDCFVNDAFGTAHRAHSSTTQIAASFDNKDKMCGLLMDAEIESAKKVMEQTKRPFTAIVGGAKVSDKVLIVENLMKKPTTLSLVEEWLILLKKRLVVILETLYVKMSASKLARQSWKMRQRRAFKYIYLLILLLQIHSVQRHKLALWIVLTLTKAGWV